MALFEGMDENENEPAVRIVSAVDKVVALRRASPALHCVRADHRNSRTDSIRLSDLFCDDFSAANSEVSSLVYICKLSD